MMSKTETPMAEPGDERAAIRDALPADIHILTWYGSEPAVALVQRDRRPSTEYANDGERIVLIEWHGGEDYALSLAEGSMGGWDLTDELLETIDTRSEAIDGAADLFNDE